MKRFELVRFNPKVIVFPTVVMLREEKCARVRAPVSELSEVTPPEDKTTALMEFAPALKSHPTEDELTKAMELVNEYAPCVIAVTQIIVQVPVWA